MLDRVDGRIAERSNKLSKLAEHEFVRSGEVPYAAIQELRLETIRLRISREDSRADLDKEIRFLCRQLCDTHHGFMATQAPLFLAETRPL